MDPTHSMRYSIRTVVGSASEQGRLNSIGGPGHSNALRPLLAREIKSFNGQFKKHGDTCIVTT